MFFCVSCNFELWPVNSMVTGWILPQIQLCLMWVIFLSWSWPAECVLPSNVTLHASVPPPCHFWQRFFYRCSLSDMTGNLYSSSFGYLVNELILSHLGPPLLQRAGLHYEWSESTSLVCVVLGATLTPWLALLDLEQTAEHVGPTCPWRLSQQLLPNSADLCENLQWFVFW